MALILERLKKEFHASSMDECIRQLIRTKTTGDEMFGIDRNKISTSDLRDEDDHDL